MMVKGLFENTNLNFLIGYVTATVQRFFWCIFLKQVFRERSISYSDNFRVEAERESVFECTMHKKGKSIVIACLLGFKVKMSKRSEKRVSEFRIK